MASLFLLQCMSPLLLQCMSPLLMWWTAPDGQPDEDGLVCAGVDFDKVISGAHIRPHVKWH
jgi:hypothetical protein